MPFFHVQTNVEASLETKTALKTDFGSIVEKIPGKTEEWLMVRIEDEKDTMWFQGSDEPCAMVEVKVYGRIPNYSYDPLTKAITEAISKRLSIPFNRIYVNYAEYSHWGYDGENF